MVSFESFQGLSSCILHTDCEPQMLPACRVPLAHESEVKKELDRLTGLGVLVSIDEPKEWVNQTAVTQKRHGSLCLCINPALLNAVLMPEHYQLPTVDEIL